MEHKIADTPAPPYFAVIFTSIKNINNDGYDAMATKMLELAIKQDGFLGIDSAQNKIGITISYWDSLEAIKNWKNQSDHQEAQKKGKSDWYKSYKVRIAKVEHDYEFSNII